MRVCPDCDYVAERRAGGYTCPIHGDFASTQGGMGATRPAASGGPPPDAPTCRYHPAVTSCERCYVCRDAICAVCDFTLPGDVHVCPHCASGNDPKPAAGRIRRSQLSIGLAVFAVIGFLWLSLAAGELGEQQAGLLWTVLSLGPACLGLGFALSAFELRLPNPRWFRIGLALNGLVTLVLIAFIVIGLAMAPG